MNAGILQGVRVVDLTRVVAGPYATRILADFGAEVIKVQTGKMATGIEDNATSSFNAWNRNKKSITLNLDHGEAREVLGKLVSMSAVVVENFTPRVMQNWGFTFDALQKLKPDLIMLSMSGMGQTGPEKDFVAYGPTLQSLGGLTYLTSYTPESPLGLGYSYADAIVGLYGAISILAALEYRDRTGAGQHIDLAGFEAVCTLIGPELLEVSANRVEVPPTGNGPRDNRLLPSGCYPCRGTDRWCVISLSREDQWQVLCGVMERPMLSRDERFASSSQRAQNRKALDTLIGEWTRTLPAEEIVQLLQEAGIAAGVVQDASDLASDPQLIARDFFATLEHPLLGRTTADTYPFKFPDHGREDWHAAPLLGADNEYVFGELLGLSAETIARLNARGII
jgi:crotonobetainyl-CoA:carnitine CoA-transferase CaiB-like acyl-CoA transferase